MWRFSIKNGWLVWSRTGPGFKARESGGFVSVNSDPSKKVVSSNAVSETHEAAVRGRPHLQLVTPGDGRCSSAKGFLAIADYVASVGATLAQMPCGAVEELVDVLLKATEAGRAIFVFGNGGSAALASHAACDLGKGTCDVARQRVRVMSLTDNVPLITAWANDTAYELVFTEQMKNFIQPGDVAFAISGSGNSPNVLHALRYAREIGATTVGLGGFEGGKMRPLCDVCVVVPSDNMQIIEDLHVMASHGIFTILRSRLAEAGHETLAAEDREDNEEQIPQRRAV
jgi:D-sedoheptulose 7-phosphate isomerase